MQACPNLVTLVFDLVNYSIWDSSLERNGLDSKVAVVVVVVGSKMKLMKRKKT